MSSQLNSDEAFIHLVFGIQGYASARFLVIPSSLRRVLNGMSFALADRFPRTLNEFVNLCHQPVADWYPFPIPDNFNPSQSILYDNQLSEEAETYCLDLSDQLGISMQKLGSIPQTALDNLTMVKFRDRLIGEIERAPAQHRYVTVRSFLIENPLVSLDTLREQTKVVMDDLVPFYEEVPYRHIKELAVCDRCGLLILDDKEWRAIKPAYCSDHNSGSPHIRMIPNAPQLYRLKRGIQLRTFIPGRIEHTLFAISEELHYENKGLLTSTERYPGLDTYDLRLSFIDTEVWGVDAKDHLRPNFLAKSIRLPEAEGDVSYTHFFFVIPNERLTQDAYLTHLKNAMGYSAPNLFVISLSEFVSRLNEKLRSLARHSKYK